VVLQGWDGTIHIGGWDGPNPSFCLFSGIECFEDIGWHVQVCSGNLLIYLVTLPPYFATSQPKQLLGSINNNNKYKSSQEFMHTY
jgi:hypothetical protein